MTSTAISLTLDASQKEGRGRFAVKKLSAFSYVAGKFFLVEKLVSMLPEHHTYVEVFGGAANLLLNKSPSRFEVYNDIQGDLVNLFRAIKERPIELGQKLDSLPWSRVLLKQIHLYLKAYPIHLSPDAEPDISRAAFYLYGVLMSFNGASGTGAKVRFAGTTPGATLRKKPTMLRLISDRLSEVFFENRGAFELIDLYDRENTLFFVDPPYWNPKGADAANIRFNAEMHARLRDKLKAIKGKFLLTYDDFPEVRALYEGFEMERYSVAKHSSKTETGQKKPKLHHLIVRNYSTSS